MKLPHYAIWTQVVSHVGPSGMSAKHVSCTIRVVNGPLPICYLVNSFSFLSAYTCGPLDARTSFIFAVVHVLGHNLTLDFSSLRFHRDEIALLSSLCCGSRRLPFSSYAEEDARY